MQAAPPNPERRKRLPIRSKIVAGAAWTLLLAATIIGFLSRTPLLAAARLVASLGALVGLGFVLAGSLTLRNRLGRQAWGLIGLSAISLCWCAGRHIHFWSMKQAVMAADGERLSYFGSHLVIGVRHPEEALQLAKMGAIGGIYLQRSFVSGKSTSGLRESIARIREARHAAAGMPFLVLADQEGGIVSHLSPPLPHMPPLKERLEGLEGARLEEAAASLGLAQGKALADIGVNLNLSPVVDLRTNLAVEMDRFSRIRERAISSDPAIVASAAGGYCRGLGVSGVGCALKHFPGLGWLATDSHFFLGKLQVSVDTLEKNDWIPFAAVPRGLEDAGQSAGRAAVMVGHVLVPSIDAEQPASLSPKIVQGVLRSTLGFNGLVLTDDLSMFPVSAREGGVGRAACEALKAGVDVLLVSYDSDLYYEAMAGLLDGCKGEIPDKSIADSKTRLRRWNDRRIANPPGYP